MIQSRQSGCTQLEAEEAAVEETGSIMDAGAEKKIFVNGLLLLLGPLVRFCFRHSLQIQDLIECCKNVYVEAARKQIEAAGDQVTTSRVSVMTGMHRRDVKRLLDGSSKLDGRLGLTLRVIGHWRTDPKFTTKARKPRVLTFGTEDSEFHELVGFVSRDLNPATVLFELERVGAVRRGPKGIKLVAESYVPKGDLTGGYRILANDAEDLVRAVEENILEQNEIPNLHVRTEYDKVRPEHAAEIRRFFIREGHLLHQRARNLISQYDQDINPEPDFKGDGVKVVLGTFSRVDE